MRRRVLIVTSSYAPTMIADMHRARHLAWELPPRGWDVEILSPDSSYQRQDCLDPDSVVFFAPETPVHYVPPFLAPLFGFAGIGSIAWRSFIPMLRAGARLLRTGRFDLVYFSTTNFSLFLVGRYWRRRFRVPYVLDIHDPCFTEAPAGPGGAPVSLKHRLAQRIDKYVGAAALEGAAGVVSVSPVYLEDLRRRYEAARAPGLQPARTEVIPFAVLAGDFERVQPGARDMGKIVYVGAGGPIMRRAFLFLCDALIAVKARRPELFSNLTIGLYGTDSDWRRGDRRFLEELSVQKGLNGSVQERPERLSYCRSLTLLKQASGALVLGVDEAGYMPSKLFSYSLSGKPLLAILRKDGPAFAAMEALPILGRALWFTADAEMPMEEAIGQVTGFLEEVAAGKTFKRDVVAESFGAPSMAQRHADLFERIVQMQPPA